MHVHHAIAALRSDLPSQRRIASQMDAVKAAWLGEDETQATFRDLKAYGRGEDQAGLETLCGLLSDHPKAHAFVDRFVAMFASALRERPLGEVPLQHNSSAGFARMQLMQSGGATLTLCAYEPLEETQAPQAVKFVDASAYEIVLSGSGNGLVHDLVRESDEAPRIVTRASGWHSGDRILRQPLRHARHIVRVERTMLVLQLSRVPVQPRPSQLYRLSDSALIGLESGDKRASEQVMALAVLGAMGDGEAIPAMENFALTLERDQDARWEAVRQVLALDSARGFALLGTLAQASGDPLAQPARQLRDQLCASEPKLRALAEETL